MSLDLDVSITGERIQTLLEATPIGVPIFWGGAIEHQALPDEFITITPLYPTEWRSWGQQRNATHTVQVAASSRTAGGSTSLLSRVAAALPATEFTIASFTPTIKVDEHYDSILTARTISAPESE